jgi:hypothetical protein
MTTPISLSVHRRYGERRPDDGVLVVVTSQGGGSAVVKLVSGEPDVWAHDGEPAPTPWRAVHPDDLWCAVPGPAGLTLDDLREAADDADQAVQWHRRRAIESMRSRALEVARHHRRSAENAAARAKHFRAVASDQEP